MRRAARSTAAFAFSAFAAWAIAAAAQEPPIYERPAPAGRYTLDPAHTSVLFRVSHLGFSMFTGRFLEAEATLDFDPAAPGTMRVSARVPIASVETHYPGDDIDFNAMVAGPEFLNATPEAPDMTFESTAVVLTGERTADVTGDLTLNGLTRPVTLAVTFNGGYAGHPLDAGARIGFSATGAISRSDFGVDFGLPAPGSTLGVGDRVEIIIEAEFLNPDAPKD